MSLSLSYIGKGNASLTNPHTSSGVAMQSTYKAIALAVFTEDYLAGGLLPRSGGAPYLVDGAGTTIGTFTLASAEQAPPSGGEVSTALWFYLNPPSSGTHYVKVPNSTGCIVGTAISAVSGESVSGIEGASSSSGTAATGITTPVVTTGGDRVVFCAIGTNRNSYNDIFSTSPQSKLAADAVYLGTFGVGSLDASAAGTYFPTWSISASDRYSIAAVAFAPLGITGSLAVTLGAVTLAATGVVEDSWTLATTHTASLAVGTTHTASLAIATTHTRD